MPGKHSSQNFSGSPISNNLTVSSNILLIRPFVLNIFQLPLYIHSLPLSTLFFAQGGLSVWVKSMGSLALWFLVGLVNKNLWKDQREENELYVFIFLSSLPVGSFQANFVPQLKVTLPFKVAHDMTLYYWILVTINSPHTLEAITSPRERHYTLWFPYTLPTPCK